MIMYLSRIMALSCLVFLMLTTMVLKAEDPPSQNTSQPPALNKEDNVNLGNLNQHIQDNYSYLEDLELGLNDPVPIDGDPDDYVVIFLERKYILIRLFPEYAPNTVAAFKEMVRQGFYNETDFFRLIPNYMIQGGDPSSSGYGGTGRLREAEISSIRFQRGMVAMANDGSLRSDDSQFFIAFDSFPWLDGKYTIFGRVISGMIYLENLQSTFINDGFLVDPIIINEIVVASNLPANKLTIKPKESNPTSTPTPVQSVAPTTENAPQTQTNQETPPTENTTPTTNTSVTTSP